MRDRSRRSAALIGALMAVTAAPPVAMAQGLRITGVTSMQYVQLRPMARDSTFAPYDPNAEEWRTRPDGVLMHCGSSNYCYWYASQAVASAAPVLQDLSLTAWGGAQGLSVHADVRARAPLIAKGFTYPRSDDAVSLLDAYVEVQRSWGRARFGRQWVIGGLGSYDFDGAGALVRRGRWSYEGWAGRALIGGLNDSHASGALATLENFPPDQDGWILGARTRLRTAAGSSLAAMYQRVLIADRSGVYSERAALDATTRWSALALDGAAAYDFATGVWNEARLRLHTMRAGPAAMSAELRHHVPFFELWTIWGAFNPVGYNEARSTVDWHPAGSHVTLSAHGAYRKYEDADAGVSLRTDGWRAGADLGWAGSGSFSALGTYEVTIGNGASRNDASAALRYTRGDALAVGLDLSALQNIYEFRVGTGRVFGVAVSVARRIVDDLRLSGDVGIYRHQQLLGAPGPDWNQQRASLRLEWSVGRDPGLASTGRPGVTVTP